MGKVKPRVKPITRAQCLARSFRKFNKPNEDKFTGTSIQAGISKHERLEGRRIERISRKLKNARNKVAEALLFNPLLPFLSDEQ